MNQDYTIPPHNDPQLYRRLSLLQLANQLGNISAACRQLGISRTSFYHWQQRFQRHGPAGLNPLPPIAKTHPQAPAANLEREILALSLKQPAWGCLKLAAQLKSQGLKISSPTVQKILIRHQLGLQRQRWLKLEEQHLVNGLAISEQQLKKIEFYDPCFRERHLKIKQPGQLLVQDSFYIGTLATGQIYLHTVIDLYNGWTFGYLAHGKTHHGAIAVLEQVVLPFYRQHQLAIISITTDNGKEFKDTSPFNYAHLLAVNAIKHESTVNKTNGFIAAFKRAVFREFFDPLFSHIVSPSLSLLHSEFSSWLNQYRRQRLPSWYYYLSLQTKRLLPQTPQNNKNLASDD